ncbi:unnamed protein product [Thlaspi arvense]|uniref:Mur ligase central domain-containing protein n=1 Tax=Thlaspi arvense TaxID=13288 RepID=A0AAU9SKR9_THLAR|nr:unnamed protein product [Thlaspi arvense]
MKIPRILSRGFIFIRRDAPTFGAGGVFGNLVFHRGFSAHSEDPELKDFIDYLDNLKNYEKSGVPKGAGTDSDEGFDLGRMRRLMERLGNPQSKYKAIHIAGTKGKGSTAAFLSNILRAQGYSVGCYTRHNSPHIRTIRERLSVGSSGEPVSIYSLNYLFQSIKKLLDQAVKFENGHLSHFEVFTGIAFSLFAQENVDIAVIEAGLGGARDATNIISSSELAASVITSVGAEHLAALGVVLGGPFLPHIEHILRDKASSMSSPVVSASDPGNRSKLKGLNNLCGKPCQSCDIVIQIEKDFQLFIELLDVKLSMLGSHQLQNAATATCAALCLRDQGADSSSFFSVEIGSTSSNNLVPALLVCFRKVKGFQWLIWKLKHWEFPGAAILLDGDDISKKKLVLVVAMANDKDHLGFARELLSGFQRYGINIIDCGVADSDKLLEQAIHSPGELVRQVILTQSSLEASMRLGNQILKAKAQDESGIIVATGSLHIVSSVLGMIRG